MNRLPNEILNLIFDQLNPSTLYTLLSSVPLKNKISDHNYYRGRMAFIDEHIFGQNDEYIHPNLLTERTKINIKLMVDCPSKFLTERLCEIIVHLHWKYHRPIGIYSIMQLKNKNIHLIKNILKRNMSAFKDENYKKYFMQPEIIMFVLKQNRTFIKFIDDEYLTKDLCIDILSEFPELANDLYKRAVPEEIINIIKKEGYSMINVPDNKLSEDDALEALDYMDIKLSDIDEQTAYKLINNNGKLLKIIPKEVITKELCIKSLHNGGDLKYCPADLMTEDEIIKYINYNTTYIPEKFITKNVIDEIYRWFRNLDIIKEHITIDLFIKFKNDNDYSNEKLYKFLKYIDPKDMTNDIEEFIWDNFPFRDIPDNVKTLKMCINAVQCDAYNLRYMPKDDMPPQVYIEAIKQNHDCDILRELPKIYRTEEYYKEFLEITPLCIRYTPDCYKTQIICDKAVEMCSKYIKYVPKQYRTTKMYYLHYKNSDSYSDFVSCID